MRVFGQMFSLVSILAVPSVAFASPLAFEDNKLNFKSCDGQVITARWRDSNFSLSLPGKSLGDAHESIEYVAWDGRCLSGRWDDDAGRFVLDDGDATKTSRMLGYIAADGSKWAGIRAGGGFFVARVAAEAEEVTPDRLVEIAAWLERKNEAFSPGVKLAWELKSAAKP